MDIVPHISMALLNKRVEKAYSQFLPLDAPKLQLKVTRNEQKIVFVYVETCKGDFYGCAILHICEYALCIYILEFMCQYFANVHIPHI